MFGQCVVTVGYLTQSDYPTSALFLIKGKSIPIKRIAIVLPGPRRVVNVGQFVIANIHRLTRTFEEST